MHESNLAESVMPGRLVAGPWTLNPGTGVRIAPRQPVLLTIEIPSSSNGRTLRSERGNRGSSPREGAGAMVYRQDG